MSDIADSSVTIQTSAQSVPSTPSWFGEVAAVAQVLTHVGVLNAIQDHVQFARARFGKYDTIDFVVVLFGYALSGEPTLQSFYERLTPFAEVFMALFDRHHLPSRSALSRYLSSLDQKVVEALRTQFLDDLLKRTSPFPSPDPLSASPTSLPPPSQNFSASIPHSPVLWKDWPRSRLRRQWLHVIRRETVTLSCNPSHPAKPMTEDCDAVVTCAKRAHYRLSWQERLARNARQVSAPQLTVTLHGLPPTFFASFALPLQAVA